MAGDSAAVLQKLDEMNLQEMPDELATALRGEFLTYIQIAYYALVIYGIPLLNSTALYIATRWKPGSITALGIILHDYYGCSRCPSGGGSW